MVSEWKTRLSFNGPKPDECSGWFLMNTTFAVLHVLTATKRLETTTAKPVPLARRQMAVPVVGRAWPAAGDAGKGTNSQLN